MRLEGKRALITAAGAGIGHATALAFAREGAQVLATDISPDGLARLVAAAPQIRTLVLDVTDAEAIRALGARHAAADTALDVLFNCAGFVHGGNVLECSEAQWASAWELNVTAMFRMVRAVLPGMLSRGGGSILNMASVASSLKAVPNRCVYSVTKAAVIGLTKSIAADFIGRNVRCNAICPGTVESPSLRARIAAQAASEGRDAAGVHRDFIARQPMGRLGKPEEIAALAVYLASDESSFTTGTAQVIDGGWTA